MFGEKIEVGKKVVFEDVDGRGIDGGLRKDEDEDNDDEDEEEKIWEEEQFRKGLGKRMDDGSSRIVSSNVPVVQTLQHQQKYTYPAEATYSSVPNVSAPPSIGGVLGASQGLDVTSIPQQAEVARKALRENARRLKESHGRTMLSPTTTDENLSTSLLNITALEKSLSAAA